MTYRAFIITNTDFDGEEEIKKGNVAVAVLVGGILLASSLIIQKGLYPVVSLFRLYLTVPIQQSLESWQFILLALAHVLMVFVVAILTISFSLRLFGKMTTKMKEGVELYKGNVAVGILLASVVLVVAMYISEGVSSLSKSLLPQPSIGKIQIMK
ncbi:MAG: DUF350 domain-containing protein [Elusimicrobia bacterium]|nr:DUF350 domain-containing protein [Elusimicrobiota bacterium]